MKKLLIVLIPLILIIALFFSRSVTVEKIRVIDGDTFTIGNKTIRLEGIDAPEKGQAYGREATEGLEELLTDIKIVEKGTDKYGRTIAQVYVIEFDVSLLLIKEGLA